MNNGYYVPDITLKRKVTNGGGYPLVYLDKELLDNSGIREGDKVLVTNKSFEGQIGIFITKK